MLRELGEVAADAQAPLVGDAELRLREAASELRGFLTTLEAEPGRLEQLEADLDRVADAKRRFREEVARWPDGVYESDTYVDHDPHGKKDIHVHCKVTVKGSSLTIDFTGSDRQAKGAINATLGVAWSASF